MKSLKKASLLLLCLCSMVGLAVNAGGCQRKKSIPQSADSITVPYQEFGKTTLYSYDGPYKIWRLETEYMRKELSDTAKMLAVPVVITMYDSQGTAGTRILADSGNTSKELRDFFIWSNVFIKTDEDLKIKSQSLWWDKETHKVGSDDFVEITTPEGDVLRGKGLDANESFSRWSLRKSVSGEFPNFRERMENEGESDDAPDEK